MVNVAAAKTGLDREIVRQQAICDALPILADIARSDVLYYDGVAPEQLTVTFHAQPHSITSLYAENRKDQASLTDRALLLAKAVRYNVHVQGLVRDHAAPPLHQEVLPLHDQLGGLIGALSIETLEIEYVNARRRGDAWRRAIELLKGMVARGEMCGAAQLTPFTNREGLVIVDRSLHITYVSAVAEELYHGIGIQRKMHDEPIATLETGDEQLLWQAIRERMCLEREETVRDAIWVRKAIPLFAAPGSRSRREWWSRASDAPGPLCALLTVADVTRERREAQERARLEAMIKEIHHRVKNNLQTIISLARSNPWTRST